MIDYKHRYTILTTPNKEGLIPAIEVIKVESFWRNLDVYSFRLNGNLLGVDIDEPYCYQIMLDNGDVKILDLCNEQELSIRNQIAIIRKWDELGIDFTKDDWKACDHSEYKVIEDENGFIQCSCGKYGADI
jgi:hypothetical protein